MKSDNFSFTNLVLFSTLVLMFTPAVVFGDIQRSCNAYYEIKFHRINNREVKIGNIKFGHFSARRGCGNGVPNKCRRRARDTAHTCMKAHYVTRIRRPAECSSSSVHNYRIHNLDQEIGNAICIPFQVNKDDVVVFSIYRVSEGDKGCGPNLKKKQMIPIVGYRTLKCEDTEDKAGGKP